MNSNPNVVTAHGLKVTKAFPKDFCTSKNQDLESVVRYLLMDVYNTSY